MEKAENIGDENDLWLPGMVIGPGDGKTFPNTDSYQGGNIVPTGITIEVVSMNEDELKFNVYGLTGTAPPDLTDTVPLQPSTPEVPTVSDDSPTENSSANGGFPSKTIAGFAFLAITPLLHWL